MGKILAEFLVEFLPFEEEPRAMIESARLVLQKELVTEEVKQSLWKKGLRKNALLVGFLKTLPDNLPVMSVEHPLFNELREKLVSFNDNVFAKIILRLFSKAGQAYLDTVVTVMKKPSNQDVVISLFNLINDYFQSVRINQVEYQDINTLLSDANKYINVSVTQFHDLKVILETLPELSQIIKAIVVMSLINESLLSPVFSRTDAIGSLMRKKTDHIISPLLTEISYLRDVS
jgi:hypothetical protein